MRPTGAGALEALGNHYCGDRTYPNQPIEARHHGDSQPVAADWDGDGLLDLIVGWGDGSVVWFRNVGSKTKPKLAKGIRLVQPAPWPSYDENAPPTEDNKPGVRAKVCVADWNGDGYLDLLVGDFGGIYGERPELSEHDKQIEQEAALEAEKARSLFLRLQFRLVDVEVHAIDALDFQDYVIAKDVGNAPSD
jgi:hypothetical protein